LYNFAVAKPHMKKAIHLQLLLSFIFISLMLLFSCRKNNEIDTDPGLRLSFSTDTVFFDTVLTTVGSVTQRLTVHNPNEKRIRISSVYIGGGSSSSYRMNVDGISAQSVTDLEIAGNDSIFIFVKATLDPTNVATPFVVADSITFMLNQTVQRVSLVAWGRNAWFHRQENLEGAHTWDSLKAHVIYGFCRVDTGASLTIMPGTRVYFHKDSYLAVSDDATLTATGTQEHWIRFLGDRLDPFYRDLPGQWGGIFLENGSYGHLLDHTLIGNGVYGLVLDSAVSSTDPMLTMSNAVIQNMTADGIMAYRSSVNAFNCVIVNCGGTALNLFGGGDFYFRHLTLGNYWTTSVRLGPSLYLNNFVYNGSGEKIPAPLSRAYFGNSVIYGPETDEILFDSIAEAPYLYSFDHCLLRTTARTSDPVKFITCILNEDPLFIDPSKNDFQIDTLSPVIGKGIPMGVVQDILGRYRPPAPSMGAYEFIP